jgi:hypothetical protein
MALFQVTAGPKIGQPVRYFQNATTEYAAFITGVNGDGTVSISYLQPGATALGTASSVKYDYTSSIFFPSWRWPEEYI